MTTLPSWRVSQMPTPIRWTKQAQADLLAIRATIARQAPRTAKAFIQRLRLHVERLHNYPGAGGIVPELGDPQIRQLLLGNYRIIYRHAAATVDILTVYHSARLLDIEEWE